MLDRCVWSNLDSCSFGIKKGNGQRKVRNGPVCVNPFHYTPNGDMFELMRPLIATLDILGYSSDTYITQVCTQLHWDPTKQQFGSRNHTIARKAFDMIVSRVRQMQDENSSQSQSGHIAGSHSSSQYVKTETGFEEKKIKTYKKQKEKSAVSPPPSLSPERLPKSSKKRRAGSKRFDAQEFTHAFETQYPPTSQTQSQNKSNTEMMSNRMFPNTDNIFTWSGGENFTPHSMDSRYYNHMQLSGNSDTSHSMEDGLSQTASAPYSIHKDPIMKTYSHPPYQHTDSLFTTLTEPMSPDSLLSVSLMRGLTPQPNDSSAGPAQMPPNILPTTFFSQEKLFPTQQYNQVQANTVSNTSTQSHLPEADYENPERWSSDTVENLLLPDPHLLEYLEGDELRDLT